MSQVGLVFVRGNGSLLTKYTLYLYRSHSVNHTVERRRCMLQRQGQLIWLGEFGSLQWLFFMSRIRCHAHSGWLNLIQRFTYVKATGTWLQCLTSRHVEHERRQGKIARLQQMPSSPVLSLILTQKCSGISSMSTIYSDDWFLRLLLLVAHKSDILWVKSFLRLARSGRRNVPRTRRNAHKKSCSMKSCAGETLGNCDLGSKKGEGHRVEKKEM